MLPEEAEEMGGGGYELFEDTARGREGAVPSGGGCDAAEDEDEDDEDDDEEEEEEEEELGGEGGRSDTVRPRTRFEG